jgi:hypothetical protein
VLYIPYRTERHRLALVCDRQLNIRDPSRRFKPPLERFSELSEEIASMTCLGIGGALLKIVCASGHSTIEIAQPSPCALGRKLYVSSAI